MPKGVWVRTPEYRARLKSLYSVSLANHPSIVRHGHNRPGNRTPTYNSWRAMIDRCTQGNHTKFYMYGATGIQVCERWRTFENFLADMGERPLDKTLDRWPNNRGNYEPGNCRWATLHEQMENCRRDTRFKKKKA